MRKDCSSEGLPSMNGLLASPLVEPEEVVKTKE